MFDLFGLKGDWAFTCDRKPEAIAFCESNFKQARCHFLDALQFLQGNMGKCLFHGLKNCSMLQFAQFLHILFVSTSCKPFSKARTLRSQGTGNHDDSQCINAFWAVLEMTQAPAILFEQVFGFCLRESKRDPISPLQRLLKTLRERFPSWSVRVFFCTGSTHLCFDRHRVYICMLHQSLGGERSLKMVETIVKAYRALHISNSASSS